MSFPYMSPTSGVRHRARLIERISAIDATVVLTAVTLLSLAQQRRELSVAVERDDKPESRRLSTEQYSSVPETYAACVCVCVYVCRQVSLSN